MYAEIKDISSALSKTEVPRVAERLLCLVESISALMNNDGNSLPADVTQVIFNALNLSLEEQKEVLPLLQDDRGVSISVMREYLADRFEVYEMIASALGSGPKSKLAPPPARFKPSDITANAATVEEAPPPRGQKKGRGGGSRW